MSAVSQDPAINLPTLTQPTRNLTKHQNTKDTNDVVSLIQYYYTIFMVYMYRYISVYSICFLVSYLLVFLFTTALTTVNILRVLKILQWDKLCDNVLQIPSSQKMKIEREFASEDQRRTAAVNFYLHNFPYASWRHIITGLDWWDEPHRIHCYAEKLTGMLQHLLFCVVLKVCYCVL